MVFGCWLAMGFALVPIVCNGVITRLMIGSLQAACFRLEAHTVHSEFTRPAVIVLA